MHPERPPFNTVHVIIYNMPVQGATRNVTQMLATGRKMSSNGKSCRPSEMSLELLKALGYME